MPKPHFDPGPATTLLDVRLVSLRVTLREACLSPSNSDFSLLTVSFHPTRFCASVSSSTLVSCGGASEKIDPLWYGCSVAISTLLTSLLSSILSTCPSHLSRHTRNADTKSKLGFLASSLICLPDMTANDRAFQPLIIRVTRQLKLSYVNALERQSTTSTTPEHDILDCYDESHMGEYVSL